MKTKRYGELLARLALMLALVAFVGCADDGSKKGGDAGDMSGDSDGGGDNGPIDFMGDGDCPSQGDPLGDFDMDGLPNALEDTNRNCTVDDGETDHLNGDSDMDGVLDGDEDVNGNGIYEPDKGETDPNNADSDGDGVPDGMEQNIVCTRDLLESLTSQPAQFADTAIALPDGYVLTQQQGAAGATFSNPALNTYGLIVKKAAPSGNAQSENSQSLVDVAIGGNQPTVVISRLFDTPDAAWGAVTYPLPNTSGVRSQILFSFGNGSPNPGAATKDPATLRDEVISAISGSPVSSGETGTACTNVSAYWLAQLRGTDLITTIIMTCDTDLAANDDLSFTFGDVLGGTILAPGNYLPNDFRCENLDPALEGGQVDFLWVIDNSGSMADEQGNIAATADQFLSTLQNTDVDWRLGVTTTETYGISEGFPPPGTDLGDDELLDPTSGLRGIGFLSPSDQDAATLFRQYVTFDAGCMKTDGMGTLIAAPDSNVCGFGFEEGLDSGLAVLELTQAETRPTYQLRPEARRIVVWVTDEEDQEVKLDAPFFESVGPSDPRWQPLVDSWIQRYSALNAIGFAIVGDAGTGNGGICEPLPNSGSAIFGAQHGETYISVANATGGASGSVCNMDLQGTIDAIIAAAIGLASQYQLGGYPISSSIRVAVDGNVIPRSRQNGWDYDPNTNSIVFFGVTFTESSQISVAYLMWERIDG